MQRRSRAVLTAAALLAFGGARAEEGESFAPVTDKATLAECSACHMAFPAGLLPARSWTALMAGLSDHFGENAALTPDVAAAVGAWLAAHAAADGARVTRGLDPGATPLRITELPWWVGAHDEVRAAAYADPKVGSKANCTACHKAAAEGLFEDD